MNIAQLSEQLKDVPQGTLIGYAKNPNSVVPQFLALAEIQRRQHLQAQAPAPTGTVADDVLAQANPVPMAPQGIAQPMPQAAQMAQQLPENQPGVAQLPTGMPQGMAAGGIVAFAGGGEAEDNEAYQDYLDKAESKKRRSGLDEMLAGLKDRVAGVSDYVPKAVKETVSGIRAALPESYEKAKSMVSSPMQGITSSHPYASVALDEAKRLGLNPSEILHMLHKETGNLKDPGKAVSKAGARGPMQLMPGTAKELGVDINDPEANTRGGVRYYAKMLDMFNGDSTLAMAAYNAGPGRVRQMLQRGHGIESLPKETQGYVKKMAKGGITHLYTGDLIDPMSTLSAGESIVPDYTPQKMSLSDYYAGQDAADISNVYAPQVAETNPFKTYMQRLRDEQDLVKNSAKEDAYLAIMQAGLGMMGGSSPYAFQNIGQGALQGVASYGASKKQRAAELANLRKGELGAMEAQHLYDYRQQQIEDARRKQEENLEFKRDKLAQAGDVASEQAEIKRINLVNAARRTAQNDDTYQALAKELSQLSEESETDAPKIERIRSKMNAIVESYVQSSLKGGKYIPPTFPKYEPPPVEQGFGSKLASALTPDFFKKAVSNVMNPSTIDLTPKQRDLLNKYNQ